MACGHDTGYAPFLGRFVADKEVAQRITLLEGGPLPTVIKNLGLKITRFRSVFSDVSQPSACPVSASQAWGRAPSGMANGQRGNNTGGSTVAAMGPSLRTGPLPRRMPTVRSDRLGPVLTNDDGLRVDKPLQVDQTVVERIKKSKLCHFLYLRGECSLHTCRSNHDFRELSDEEFNALWSLARLGRCRQSKKGDRNPQDDCSDVMCVYGHRSESKQGT